MKAGPVQKVRLMLYVVGPGPIGIFFSHRPHAMVKWGTAGRDASMFGSYAPGPGLSSITNAISSSRRPNLSPLPNVDDSVRNGDRLNRQ